MSRNNRTAVWDYSPVPSGLLSLPRTLGKLLVDPLGRRITGDAEYRESKEELAKSLTLAEGLRLIEGINDALTPTVDTSDLNQ